MSLDGRAADVRIVRIQKYAQLEPPSERLALPTLQKAGQEQEDHWVTGFSLSRGGAQQATAQLSIGSGNSLAQPNQTEPCPACLCWQWQPFRRVLSAKGCGNLCRGCSGMGRNLPGICQYFQSKARVNPWLDEDSGRTRCRRQELRLGSQTVSVQTSALKLTCYGIWNKWPPLCASVATPIKCAW